MTIISFEDLQKISQEQNKKIYEIAQEEETEVNGWDVKTIRKNVSTNLTAMKEAIKNGLKSSEKSVSKWSGDDCARLQAHYKIRKSLFGKLFEKIMTYSIATAEENLRMGRVVACPTAGSCGIIPSVLIAASEELNLSEDELINALLTAGFIGLTISYKVNLAGAVAGCQAECGVAAAMAAAALTTILGGSTEQVLNAANLVLKNVLGLTCDPVAGLVEVPCIKRNSFLAIQAVTAAELSMADVYSKIPIDEVVDTLKRTGELMSPLLKETSQGGLAKTKTAKELEKTLKQKINNI